MILEGNSFLSKMSDLRIGKRIFQPPQEEISKKSMMSLSDLDIFKKKKGLILSDQEKFYLLRNQIDEVIEEENQYSQDKDTDTQYEKSNNEIVNSKKDSNGKVYILKYEEKIEKVKEKKGKPVSQINLKGQIIDKSKNHLKIGDNNILDNIKIENIQNIKDNQIENADETLTNNSKKLNKSKREINKKKTNNNNVMLINENQSIEITKELFKVTSDGHHMHVSETFKANNKFIIGDEFHLAKNANDDINTINKY